MKNIKYYLLSLLAVGAMASCEKGPQPGETPEAKQLTIVATTDGTVIPEWKAADEIMVVCADELYTFTADAAGKTANFTETEGTLTTDMVGDNAISAYYNCTNMFGTFRIQAEQTYKDGASSTLVPAYAYTLNAPVDNKLALAFKPLASVLNLTVAPYDITIEKIIIAPAEGAVISEGALAGTFTADAAQGTVKVTNELNEVTIIPSAPIDLKQGTSFNIPLGWFAIEGGLQITMIYEGTKEYPLVLWADAGVVKSYSDEGGLKSAKIIAETFEFDANSFPRNWYVKADAQASAKGLSWETATTLENALQTALPGSVLHLAAGTYVPQSALKYTLSVDGADVEAPAEEGFKNFLIENNITLIGGYPANAATGAVADAAANATILDGNGKAYHTLVVAAPKMAGEKVVVEGITIKGGMNTAEATAILALNEIKLAASNGAGIALLGSAVDLKNVTVTGNTAVNNAGLYCVECDINMTGCTITENEATGNAGGGLFTTGTKLVMDGCSVSKNKATGFAGGLYLYVPAEKAMEFDIRNSHFDNNTATGNCGGVYVRDDSGANLMKAVFTKCTFNYNSGNMGGCLLANNTKMTFNGCEFKGNQNIGNGCIYMYTTTADGKMEITFDGCSYIENVPGAGAGTGVIGGIYLYTNGPGAYDVYVKNCYFGNNTANGRAASLYMRNGKVGQTNLFVANTTFANNTAGSLGTAINLYGTTAYKVNATVVNCTATGNTSTHETNNGVFCCETAGTTMNIYNTISAGNKTTGGTACDVNNKAGAMNIKYSLIGAEYYGADGAVAAVTPAFDYTTMLGTLGTDGTIRLVGNASGNPAFGNGMTVADLKALANGSISADDLAKDQTGTARNDSDKIIGACVKK